MYAMYLKKSLCSRRLDLTGSGEEHSLYDAPGRSAVRSRHGRAVMAREWTLGNQPGWVESDLGAQSSSSVSFKLAGPRN